MDNEDFLEMLELLRSQGFEAEVCSEPWPVLTQRVVCGTPVPVLDEDIEQILELPKSIAKDIHGFILRVRGDSMEPRYSEGDLVIVQRCESARDGQNVVVMHNNEGTLKTLVHDRMKRLWLVPKNRAKHKPILVKEGDDFRIMGVVRGRINIEEQEPISEALDAVDDFEAEMKCAKKRPAAASLRDLMSEPELAEDRLERLGQLLRGQRGRRVALVVTCAMELGWFVERPSFVALTNEFGNLGNISGYNKQIKLSNFFTEAEKKPVIDFLTA